MSITKIPFNRAISVELPVIGPKSTIAGDGPYTKKCHAFLESSLQVSKVLLTTSCTHALEMSALLLDVEPGDEVLVPSFTFVSTVNAFVLRGARPVFVDIRPDTLNIDERDLARKITPRSKVIVPVHYAGVACEMDEIMALADANNIAVVEDAAHALMGSYKGRPLGSIGNMATFSFHETKNFTSGEGGALVIRDERFIERAEIIREKGTNRCKFFRGEVDKYTWVDVGSSYLPSDILAGVLLEQFERATEIQEKRKKIWYSYYDGLRDWAEKNRVRLPVVPEHLDQAYHMFYMLLPSEQDRDRLMNELKEKQIGAVFHYLPLHLSPMAECYGGRQAACPVTEDISGRLLRLPFFYDLSTDDQSRVIETVMKFTVG